MEQETMRLDEFASLVLKVHDQKFRHITREYSEADRFRDELIKELQMIDGKRKLLKKQPLK